MTSGIKEIHGATKHMVKYLNHTDYNRWYRNYLLNLARYAAELDALRLNLDDLPGKEKVEPKFEEIDKKMEEIIPRNFDQNSLPLEPGEVFLENTKVIFNLLFQAVGAEVPFQGVYQTEKERILKKHQEYRFKDQFKDLKAKVETMVDEHNKLVKEANEAIEAKKAQASKEAQESQASQEEQEAKETHEAQAAIEAKSKQDQEASQ